MRKLLLCLLCLGTLTAMMAQAPATPLTFTNTYNGVPLPIPIDSADTAVLMTITVNRSITITKVTASVQVSYPAVGDLNVYLFSPTGTRVKLLERNCGTLKNIDTTFDDAATTKYADFCPAEAGRGPYSGNEPLRNVNGQDSLGVWTLAVENNGSDTRTGSAVGFSLTFAGTAKTTAAICPQCIRDSAAPLATDKPIAPGQIISVFGYNLGPQEGISNAGTNWPTWTDGTVVRINGIDAPMRYISFYRIDVQVPTQTPVPEPTATIPTTKVSVFRNGVSTNEIDMAIAAASPAVFTPSGLGTGQANAFNPDGTANSGSNPVSRGSTISVFVNGLGVTEPTWAAGQTTPAEVTFVPVLPVTATIGGVVANVVRAYLSPGRIGVFVVDVTVPAAVRPGVAEVLVSAGWRTSQVGATIQVR